MTAERFYPGRGWMNTLNGDVKGNLEGIDALYDAYFAQNPEWSEVESNLYNKVDELVDELKKASAQYAEYLRAHTRP